MAVGETFLWTNWRKYNYSGVNCETTRSSYGRLCLLCLTTIIFMDLIILSGGCFTLFRGFNATIYPRGDINLEYGDPLDMNCTLNFSTPYNSSKIFFALGNRKLNEFTSIIDEKTISLFIPKPEKRYKSLYKCGVQTEVGDKALCLSSVTVGTSPLPVTDFHCLSFNLDNLTCSWTGPNNYLDTNYSLTYNVGGDPSSAKECPGILKEIFGIRDNYNYNCTWSTTSSVQLLPNHETFELNLTAVNALGSRSFVHQFDNNKEMQPNGVINLQIIKIETHSFTLFWEAPPIVKFFTPGFKYLLRYKSRYDPHWIERDLINLDPKARNFTYKLENLRYAYTLYDIRVFVKSKYNNNNNWTVYSAKTEWTLPQRPDRPPLTATGSFYIDNSGMSARNVTIYWEQIEDYEKNGENFTYKIMHVVEAGIKKPIAPVKLTDSFAMFHDVSLKELNFSIASCNGVGCSVKSSYVYVPDRNELIPQPITPTKIAYKNGKYGISWIPIQNNNKIDSYTIFWCQLENEPYQCLDKLNSKIVYSNETANVTISSDKNEIIQFAVSANSGYNSSGMVWATCTVSSERMGIGKMKLTRVDTKATYVEVGWDLECQDPSRVITGYKIFYCPISHPEENICRREEEETIEVPGNSTSATVNHLKPVTSYLVSVAVMTSKEIGQQSDYLHVATLEGTPSPPTALNATVVTNDTVTLTWRPPQHRNGKINQYIVKYSEKEAKLSMDSNDPSLVVADLTSYTNYTFSVVACTTQVCSNSSDPIQVRTKVGNPGQTDEPSYIPLNDSVQLKWSLPKQLGKYTVDSFEIKVVKLTSSNENETLYFNTSELNFILPGTICYSDNSQRSVKQIESSVRAVNLHSHMENVQYFGPWSRSATYGCPRISTGNPILYWVLGVPLAAIILVAILFGSKRIWYHVKTMRDIIAILPPGLEPVSEKEVTKYPLNNWSPPIKHKDDKSFLKSSSDEVSLLHNKIHNNVHGTAVDVSGVSDHTDSTTLSLTSIKGSTKAHTLDEPNSESSVDSLGMRNLVNPSSKNTNDSSQLQKSPYEKRKSAEIEISSSPWGEFEDDLEYMNDVPTKDDPFSFIGVVNPPTKSTNGYVSAPPIESLPTLQQSKVQAPSHYVQTAPAPLARHPQPLAATNPVVTSNIPQDYVRFDNGPCRNLGANILETKHPFLSDFSRQSLMKDNCHALPQPAVPCMNSGPVLARNPTSGYVSVQEPVRKYAAADAPPEPPAGDNVSPEAYCKFGWNSEANQNVHSSPDNLLHGIIFDESQMRSDLSKTKINNL